MPMHGGEGPTRPKYVAPEALQPGGGMALPGAEEMARMGVGPGPLTRGARRVTEEGCPVCAQGQGMCACPGEAMVSPSRPAYVGPEKLAVPGPGEPMGEAVVGEAVGMAQFVQEVTAPAGITAAAAVPTGFQIPFGAFVRQMRQPELRVPEARPRFETIVTAGGPVVAVPKPPARPTVAAPSQKDLIEKMRPTLEKLDTTAYRKFVEKTAKRVQDMAEKQRAGTRFHNLPTIVFAGAIKDFDLAQVDLGNPESQTRKDSVRDFLSGMGKLGELKDIAFMGLALELAADKLLPLPDALTAARWAAKIGKGLSKTKKLKDMLENLEKGIEKLEELESDTEKFEKLGETLEKAKEVDKVVTEPEPPKKP